jgi:hypothetical protein
VIRIKAYIFRSFLTDGLVAQFYYQPTTSCARLLLVQSTTSRQKPVTNYYCSFVTRLKLRRTETCLDLHRLDKISNSYSLWARLAFVDYERLALFYSVFVALKDQDISALVPSTSKHDIDLKDTFRIDAEEDYVYLPNEEIYGGQIVFGSKRHALRIYKDKMSGGARLEARPLRGPKKHVPIWSAFIPLSLAISSSEKIRVAGSLGTHGATPSVKFVSSLEVELRKLPVFTFLDGFEMPPPSRKRTGALGGGGGKLTTDAGDAFAIQFAEEEDAETFVRIIKSLISGREIY